ncbi:MAG TPA: hypothetical protein VJ608_10005, partial [Albitalea sp.]|nr:hypothetical protein [Albitalea sp.]
MARGKQLGAPGQSVPAISPNMDGAATQDDAASSRAEAGLAGPPTRYEIALAAALKRMISWSRAGKFKPTNEEDVQCFLYHALVLELDTAAQLRAKPTHSKPDKTPFADGKRLVGDMHFPDLIIGDPNEPDAIYIEIKVRAPSRTPFHGACLADVKKLGKHHLGHRQFFILYDCDPKVVYLNEEQKEDLLQAAAPGCTVWHYPRELDINPRKVAAAK